MTVTELALLHLSPDATVDNAVLRSKLAHAKKVMQDYTHRTFYYLQQMEDPSYVYIVGEWDSLNQHMNNFIPGPENQSVLESLKNEVGVEWLLHIDAPHASLPLPKTTAEKAKAHNGELIWTIVRCFVKDGQKSRFEDTFEANKQYIQDFVTEGTIAGGWRVDKEDDKDEFVSLCPWTSVEQHARFVDSDGFAKFGKIREHIDGRENKLVKLLDI